MRQGTRLAVLLLLAGCIEAASVVGNAPQNPTRELPHDGSDAAKSGKTASSRSDQYRRHQNEADAAGPRVVEVDPEQARIGVASTRDFHAAGCRRLDGIPTAEQIRFTTRWDALDTGYRPCDDCRAMR